MPVREALLQVQRAAKMVIDDGGIAPPVAEGWRSFIDALQQILDTDFRLHHEPEGQKDGQQQGGVPPKV